MQAKISLFTTIKISGLTNNATKSLIALLNLVKALVEDQYSKACT